MVPKKKFKNLPLQTGQHSPSGISIHAQLVVGCVHVILSHTLRPLSHRHVVQASMFQLVPCAWISPLCLQPATSNEKITLIENKNVIPMHNEHRNRERERWRESDWESERPWETGREWLRDGGREWQSERWRERVTERQRERVTESERQKVRVSQGEGEWGWERGKVTNWQIEG